MMYLFDLRLLWKKYFDQEITFTIIMEVNTKHLQSFLPPKVSLTSPLPPYTPEHNGYSERHHHHIVETNLSFISYASFSIAF